MNCFHILLCYLTCKRLIIGVWKKKKPNWKVYCTTNVYYESIKNTNSWCIFFFFELKHLTFTELNIINRKIFVFSRFFFLILMFGIILIEILIARCRCEMAFDSISSCSFFSFKMHYFHYDAKQILMKELDSLKPAWLDFKRTFIHWYWNLMRTKRSNYRVLNDEFVVN